MVRVTGLMPIPRRDAGAVLLEYGLLAALVALAALLAVAAVAAGAVGLYDPAVDAF